MTAGIESAIGSAIEVAQKPTPESICNKFFIMYIPTTEIMFETFQVLANSTVSECMEFEAQLMTMPIPSPVEDSAERLSMVKEIFAVFETIENMEEDVERMVEAAKWHASNSFTMALIHAVWSGLSIHTYRAMTAQRIINWGKL